jgi:hypothetical protein
MRIEVYYKAVVLEACRAHPAYTARYRQKRGWGAITLYTDYGDGILLLSHNVPASG